MLQRRLAANPTEQKEQVTYVFQTVQVLVPFAASLAAERLLLLHAQGAGIGSASLGVDDGEGPIAVLMQLLRLMAMSFVVSRSESPG